MASTLAFFGYSTHTLHADHYLQVQNMFKHAVDDLCAFYTKNNSVL